MVSSKVIIHTLCTNKPYSWSQWKVKEHLKS